MNRTSSYPPFFTWAHVCACACVWVHVGACLWRLSGGQGQAAHTFICQEPTLYIKLVGHQAPGFSSSFCFAGTMIIPNTNHYVWLFFFNMASRESNLGPQALWTPHWLINSPCPYPLFLWIRKLRMKEFMLLFNPHLATLYQLFTWHRCAARSGPSKPAPGAFAIPKGIRGERKSQLQIRDTCSDPANQILSYVGQREAPIMVYSFNPIFPDCQYYVSLSLYFQIMCI